MTPVSICLEDEVLVLVAIVAQVSALDWNTEAAGLRWALKCDFPHNDIHTMPMEVTNAAHNARITGKERHLNVKFF